MEKIQVFSEKLEGQVSISTGSAQAIEVVGWINSGWSRS